MSLVALPDELLGHICTFLELREIKNLRLTSQSLRAVANEYLLPELVTFYTPRSIDTASCLATDRPELAKGIRLVRFRGERLPDYVDLNAWNAISDRLELGLDSPLLPVHLYSEPVRQLIASNIKSRTTYHASKHMYSYQLRGAGETPYDQYQRLRSEQQLLDVNGSNSALRQAFRTLFSGCPHLGSVHIGSSIGTGTQGQYNRRFHLRSRQSTGDSLPAGSGVHALTQILQAAHDEGRKVSELVVTDVSNLFFDQSDPVLLEIYSIASGLEVFRWRFAECGSFGDDDNEDGLWLASFHGFISQARNLRVLDLDMSKSTYLRQQLNRRAMALSDLIGETIFHRLEEISLRSISTCEATISTLLLRHSGTLTSISISRIDLQSGVVPDAAPQPATGSVWEACFQSIAGKLQRLVNLSLEHLDESTSESRYWHPYWSNRELEEAVEYFRHGGTELPKCLQEHEWDSDQDM